MRSYCIITRQLKWSFITLFVCTLADSIWVIAFSVHKPLHFKRYISPVRKFKLAQERHHFLFIIQVLNGWNGNFSKWEIDFFWHWNKQTAWIVSHHSIKSICAILDIDKCVIYFSLSSKRFLKKITSTEQYLKQFTLASGRIFQRNDWPLLPLAEIRCWSLPKDKRVNE